MLLTNARAYTLASNSIGPVVDTLVVRDHQIAFAGRRADVNPAVGEAVLDLRGPAIVPGLVDAHAHLTGAAAWSREDEGEADCFASLSAHHSRASGRRTDSGHQQVFLNDAC
jgi:predicted amidohydrolase YtcJ